MFSIILIEYSRQSIQIRSFPSSHSKKRKGNLIVHNILTNLQHLGFSKPSKCTCHYKPILTKVILIQLPKKVHSHPLKDLLILNLFSIIILRHQNFPIPLPHPCLTQPRCNPPSPIWLLLWVASLPELRPPESNPYRISFVHVLLISQGYCLPTNHLDRRSHFLTPDQYLPTLYLPFEPQGCPPP